MSYGNKESRKNVVGPVTELKGIQSRRGPGSSFRGLWVAALAWLQNHLLGLSHTRYLSLQGIVPPPLFFPALMASGAPREEATACPHWRKSPFQMEKSVALTGSPCLLPLTVLRLHRRSRFSGSSLEVIRVCILCDQSQSQCPSLG